MKKFKKAILFQNAGVGDFLMALFLAEQLRESGVTDTFYIVVHKGSQFLRGFMGAYPYISLVEVSPSRPASLLSLARLFGRENLVILPPTIGRFPLKIKLLAWALAKPNGFLVGFQDQGFFCKALYSKTIPYDISRCFDKSVFDIVRALKITGVKKSPQLHIHPAANIIEHIELLNKKYVFVHPRGSSDRRRLTDAEAKTLIDFILSTNPERKVLISGAENERSAIEEMVKSASEPNRIFTAIGTTPEELAALIEGAELFVGMDTGITHMACFLGKKALVIAKNATANWLPYYNKNATVIFRFVEDEESHTNEEYMRAHQNGRLRPFKDVPIHDVNTVLATLLDVPA